MHIKYFTKDYFTFCRPNLHYDGAGPDAYFWVGNGSEPNIMGIKVSDSIMKSFELYIFKLLYFNVLLIIQNHVKQMYMGLYRF